MVADDRARSSRSKVERKRLEGLSRLEKKPRGRLLLSSRTAPIATSEASVVRCKVASSSGGWLSTTHLARVARRAS